MPERTPSATIATSDVLADPPMETTKIVKSVDAVTDSSQSSHTATRENPPGVTETSHASHVLHLETQESPGPTRFTNGVSQMGTDMSLQHIVGTKSSAKARLSYSMSRWLAESPEEEYWHTCSRTDVSERRIEDSCEEEAAITFTLSGKPSL
ncbi:hypothetical protein BU16DRAFT_561704 [Lophium mytilinum]|uniref:Uncharacterized protein n=1 Tax=Lophium mytilinum TaxID=390894 RepID=A0A6A6QTI6_9PEZI|nr:hypothetical protein BU16DRAFT_561704 [Lophium mytilinum]